MAEDMIPGTLFFNFPGSSKNEPPPPEQPASEDARAGDAPPDDAPPENAPPEDNVPEDDTVENQTCERMDKREFCFQVSAKHMMFASSFFKKALTGAWKESETYQQKGSVEITADGWDSEALLIILRAIHCQYNQIPKKVTLEMLAKIAAIADYYDCKDVLYIMTDIWFGSLGEKAPTSSRDLALWLWVAWFFKLPKKFSEYTSLLMSRSDDLIGFRGLPIPARVTGKGRCIRKLYGS
ncbi:uncharacterized protein N7483_010121 [Penicillium malachiteum]|uniref:uncharacterized protein n=1 Tax=Penicillium malachiteum TaxID=1324776 RepID=UPI0025485BD7|nr:uncharacterized protein N7483_010121 [Penicillium malachiteum]KAJ5712940.1 hypothetical protein N7483_010121 [Penicillium malachiteum]